MKKIDHSVLVSPLIRALFPMLCIVFYSAPIGAAPPILKYSPNQKTQVAPLPALRDAVKKSSASPSKCTQGNPDFDRDGANCFEYGGLDCDDNDPLRTPGRPEVCDVEGHDEDCDPMTFGVRDMDLDGWADSRCCNGKGGATERCGNDCDDSNPAITPGSQMCGRGGANEIFVCRGFQSGARVTAETCHRDGEVCLTQPNGTGWCAKP